MVRKLIIPIDVNNFNFLNYNKNIFVIIFINNCPSIGRKNFQGFPKTR